MARVDGSSTVPRSGFSAPGEAPKPPPAGHGSRSSPEKTVKLEPLAVAPVSTPDGASARLLALQKQGAPKLAAYPGIAAKVRWAMDSLSYSRGLATAADDAAYEHLKLQGQPRRSSYPAGQAGNGLYQEDRQEFRNQMNDLQRKLAPVYLDRYEKDILPTSPTASALFQAAQAQGIDVQVLPDAEFYAKFPGTAGVTTEGTCYLPISSLEDTTDGALEHELTHAVLAKYSLFDSKEPLADRVTAARNAFTELGLDPEDGERLARNTQGWSNGEAGDHVFTSIVNVDVAREEAGLPELSDIQRNRLFEDAGFREAALAVKGPLDRGEITGAEAETRWSQTSQGAAHPPWGTTPAERQGSLLAILSLYADSAPLDQYQPGNVLLK